MVCGRRFLFLNMAGGEVWDREEEVIGALFGGKI